jgi:hypothetical protein
MITRTRLSVLVLTLLFAAACSSESKQTQPVTTKTDSGTSTAPAAKDAQQRDKALVRVINAVPGNNSFDIFADDQKVFESVAFKTVTPYKELSDASRAFRLRRAGENPASQPLAENSEGLSGGKHYTLMVVPGTNDRTTIELISDNLTTPAANKAQVRVIHASPDAGEVDIVDKQANKKMFSGVNFESETSYMDVDPMKTTLEVRQEGQDKPIVSLPNANFEKGKFYTIVVTGLAKGMPKLQTLLVEDQLGSGATASVPSKDGKMVKAKGPAKY